MYAHLAQHWLQIYSVVNCLPEDGQLEPTHVGGTPQTNKYSWLNVQLGGLNTV
jgi:hypothetical protein